MSDHVIIEASEPIGTQHNWALTIQWPDGTETLELVSEHAAKLLGLDVERGDGTKAPRPLTAAEQATLVLHARRNREEADYVGR